MFHDGIKLTAVNPFRLQSTAQTVHDLNQNKASFISKWTSTDCDAFSEKSVLFEQNRRLEKMMVESNGCLKHGGHSNLLSFSRRTNPCRTGKVENSATTAYPQLCK